MATNLLVILGGDNPTGLAFENDCAQDFIAVVKEFHWLNMCTIRNFKLTCKGL
jgi:hypothetical protein